MHSLVKFWFRADESPYMGLINFGKLPLRGLNTKLKPQLRLVADVKNIIQYL